MVINALVSTPSDELFCLVADDDGDHLWRYGYPNPAYIEEMKDGKLFITQKPREWTRVALPPAS